jgi:hypothetical protein
MQKWRYFNVMPTKKLKKYKAILFLNINYALSNIFLIADKKPIFKAAFG